MSIKNRTGWVVKAIMQLIGDEDTTASLCAVVAKNGTATGLICCGQYPTLFVTEESAKMAVTLQKRNNKKEGWLGLFQYRIQKVTWEA